MSAVPNVPPPINLRYHRCGLWFNSVCSSLPCLSCSLQVRYGYIWSALVGRRVGSAQELDLYENEAIVQVGGFIDTEIPVGHGIVPFSNVP